MTGTTIAWLSVIGADAPPPPTQPVNVTVLVGRICTRRSARLGEHRRDREKGDTAEHDRLHGASFTLGLSCKGDAVHGPDLEMPLDRHILPDEAE